MKKAPNDRQRHVDAMQRHYKRASYVDASDIAAMVALLRQIARMETAEEYDARTDDEGMCGDDAVEALSGLIKKARKVLEVAGL
jgi:hypothetical protein